MDSCVILVDNSNIYIEGQKYAAKQKGILRENPSDKVPQDASWRINFGELIKCLANGRKIHTAILVGSRPPQNDSVWEAATQSGFNVIIHERDGNNREKAVDTELVAQGTAIIYTVPEPMTLIIASGDRDFIPLVIQAHSKAWEVEMAAFASAYNRFGEMAKKVNRTVCLDDYFDQIGIYESEQPTI